MYVVVLGGFVQLSVPVSAVNHPTTEGNGPVQDVLQDLGVPGVTKSGNPALRQGQVDGFCKVQRHR
jgi:hypothetical protein